MYEVYFIQALSKEGLIKIGYSKDLNKRIKTFKTANGVKLKLLHRMQCTSKEAARTVEKTLHQIFEYGRRQGEWFTQNQPLIKTINKLKEGTPFSEVKQFAYKASQKKWEDKRKGLRIHLTETGQLTPRLEQQIAMMGRPPEETVHWQKL